MFALLFSPNLRSDRLLPLIAAVFLLQTYACAHSGFPDAKIHGDIAAGYYAVSDVYRYIADVNVWFDFGASNGAAFFFNGGIQTLIKGASDERFQPDRYRGTLEPGVKWAKGENVYSLFVKHQSFHDIDKYDGIDESYEIVGIRYARASLWNFNVSAGKYIYRQDVDYDWDFTASVDSGRANVCPGRRLYGAASAHYVTSDGSLTSRDGFLDYMAEFGYETRLNVRYFVAYQVVHDIDRFAGRIEKGLLFGVRYKW